MKRTILFFWMLLLVSFGFAQVSKQQAINSVMSSIVGNDADRVNVYMEPLSKTETHYKMSQYDSILAPYANYWLFFIDDMPEYGWGHDCRYVFVNSSTGATSVVNSQKPPYHYKLKLDGISEPISFDLGDLYLEMEENGEKGISGKLRQYVPLSIQAHKMQSDFALSLLPNAKEANVEANNEIDIPPITNLEVSASDNDTVLLTWGLPEGYDSDIWLSWCSMLYTNHAFGCAASQCATDQAAQFDIDDLRNFIGWRIKDVTVMLSRSDTVYSPGEKDYFVRIWKGGEDDDYSLVYEKQINNVEYSIPLTVPVDSTILIEEGEEVRIGWYLDRYTLYPWEMDEWPVAPKGKGFYFRYYHRNQNNDVCEADDMWDNYWPFQTGNLNVAATLTYPDREAEKYNHSNQITGYRIYRNGEQIKEIPYSFVTYFTDTEYTKGVDVEYCVTAVYGEEESEPVCATATITGVGEGEDKGGITILPNPTNGVVRIEGANVAEVQVYNALGRLVKTMQGSNEISVAELPQGVYLVRILDAEGRAYTNRVTIR